MTVYRRPDPIPLRRAAATPSHGQPLAAVREPEDLNRLAARAIFQAIAAGRYPAGSILPNEYELAAELGVSRTALREAIKGLVAKGIVETRRKRGTQVLDPTRWNMLDAELIAWSRRDGSLRVSEELWSALIEATAVLAGEAAAQSNAGALGAAVTAFAAASGTQARREAFCLVPLEIAAAGSNRYLRSLVNSCLRSLLHDDAAFLDRQIERLPGDVLTAIAEAIRMGRPDTARELSRRILSPAVALV